MVTSSHSWASRTIPELYFPRSAPSAKRTPKQQVAIRNRVQPRFKGEDAGLERDSPLGDCGRHPRQPGHDAGLAVVSDRLAPQVKAPPNVAAMQMVPQHLKLGPRPPAANDAQQFPELRARLALPPIPSPPATTKTASFSPGPNTTKLPPAPVSPLIPKSIPVPPPPPPHH